MVKGVVDIGKVKEGSVDENERVLWSSEDARVVPSSRGSFDRRGRTPRCSSGEMVRSLPVRGTLRGVRNPSSPPGPTRIRDLAHRRPRTAMDNGVPTT